MDTGLGLIFALISLICNGSFSAFNKLQKVTASNVHPQIFNLYFIFGVIISSILVYIVLIIMGDIVEFTYLGVISGLCLCLCGVSAFAAIKYIGLSIGVTIWSGTAILVSFIQGFIAGTKAENLFIAICGCVLLIAGIVGVGFSDKIVDSFMNKFKKNDSEETNALLNKTNVGKNEKPLGEPILNQDLNHSMDGIAVLNENSPKSNNKTKKNHDTAKNEQETVEETMEDNKYGNILIGIIFAVLTGLFGGSVGFPSNWTSEDDNNANIKYLISLAVGCCLIIPITILWIIFVYKFQKNYIIEWHLKSCLIPGLLAGLVWNCANVASLYAIQSVGYAVAYPIMQSSLIVANLWGIFVFKEVTDKYVICALFLFCFIVMGGCGLITIGVIGV